MEILCFRLFVVIFYTLFVVTVSVPFSPENEYLVDCGSVVDSTVDNRRFIGDAKLFSSEGSISLRSEDPALNLPQIYRTARIFPRKAKYEFSVGAKGIQMVRLHFHRFNSSEINFNDAEFHVIVNGYVLLRNFSGYDQDSSTNFQPSVREFLIWVDTIGKVVIRFIPSKDSKLAYINAMEVISAPKDLIADVATSVTQNGTEKFTGLAHQSMEVVYRINVGGRKLIPFNDTLWRTWIPDDRFLKVSNGSEKIYFSGWIKYTKGGASREVGPDNVYNTARIVKSNNGSIPQVNMTWEFPVNRSYKHLIRMHFCDIASLSLDMLHFNIYINGNLAYQDFDISDLTGFVLASPFYIDFVVGNEYSLSDLISISIGPSSKSVEYAVDGILNGIEILKMNNTMGSFDGYVSTEMVLRNCTNRRNLGLFLSMVAFVCILMSVYILMQRREVRDGFNWSRLSENSPEDMKTRNRIGLTMS